MKYKAFISYSHATDRKLAPYLQTALQSVGRPWYKLKAFDIFRDETDLSATPELWNEITAALAESEYFILLASPRAAQSKWVKQEIEYWLAHNEIDKLLIGLTEGALVWSDFTNDFDWEKSKALPETLKGNFSQEPLFIDFRDIKKTSDLSVRKNIDFRLKIFKLAATLHGKPLEEFGNEERIKFRQRATTRIALVLLFIALLYQRPVIYSVLVLSTFVLVYYFYQESANKSLVAKKKELEVEEKVTALQSSDLALKALEIQESDCTLALRLAEEAIRLNNSQKAVAALQTVLSNPENVYYSKLLHTRSNSIIKIIITNDKKEFFACSAKGKVTKWTIDGKRKLDEFDISKKVRSLKEYNDIQEFGYFEKSGFEEFWFITTNEIIIKYNVGFKQIRKLNLGQIYSATGLKIEDPDDFDNHFISIDSFAISKKGELVVIGLSTGKVIYWDYYSGQGMKVIHHGAWGDANKVKISETLDLIIVGSISGNAVILDCEGNVIVELKDGHTEAISDLCFSKDNSLFFTCSLGNKGIVWDEKGAILQELVGHNNSLTCISYDNDNKIILTGSYDGSVFLWNLAGDILKKCKGHLPLYGVCSTIFSSASNQVITGGGDTTIRIWNTDSCIKVSQFEDSELFSIVDQKNSSFLVILGNDKALRFTTYDGQVQEKLHLPGDTGEILATSLEHQEAITANWKNTTIELWSFETKEKIATIDKVEKVNILAVYFVDNGRSILLIDKNKKEIIFFTRKGEATDRINFSIKSISGSVLSRNEKFVYLFGAKGEVVVINTIDKKIDIINLNIPIQCLCPSPNNDLLLVGTENNILIWNLKDKAIEKKFLAHVENVEKILVSSSGKYLFTLGNHGNAVLWKGKGVRVQTIFKKNHFQNISSISISHDESRLVTVDRNGWVRIWRNGDHLLNTDIITDFRELATFKSRTIQLDQINELLKETGDIHTKERIYRSIKITDAIRSRKK